jgi:hypothetical protein
MSEKPISPLRRRMIEDMTVRNFVEKTRPCPCCGGRMNIIETFNRGSTPQYRPPPPTVIRIDTS